MKTIKLKESDLQRIVKSVVNESAWSEEESRPVSFTSEDREMLRRIYDVVVRGGSAGGYGGVRKRAIPALGTLPELQESFDYDEEEEGNVEYNIILQLNRGLRDEEGFSMEIPEIEAEELLDIPDSYEEGIKIFQQIKDKLERNK
tara:strand:+ start:287 stop:721 length:435 start_codon:yes stop_codon:yes gene_type:complete